VSAFRETGAPEDEGQHLQSVYPIAKVHGGPGRFGFDPASHLTEDSPLVTAENRARILEEWSPHWDLERPVLLEKSPPNLLKTRFLQALFPESRFVIIMRHPIPVALATARWRETRGLHRLVRHWLVCHERFAADRPRLAQVHVVRYEDLVRDPADTLAGVFGFLGLDGSPRPVDVDSGPNRRYLERWEELKNEPFMRLYLGLTELRYERRARRFGYSLRPPYEAPRRSS
jgi:Sulfotransferase family